MKIQLTPIHGNEKCFYDESIDTKVPCSRVSGLLGERVSFQFAYTALDEPGWSDAYPLTWTLDSALPCTLSSVELVPNREPIFHKYRGVDPQYLRTDCGLYPDLLRPLGKLVHAPCTGLRSLFCSVEIPADAAGGEYPVTLTLYSGENAVASASVTVQVIPTLLPKQTLCVTQWFHSDCLATQYEVDVFSEEHWRILENYIRKAVSTGTNAILTPIFTPPLDTLWTHERPTVQLIDMTLDRDGWHFGFDKLERWVEMCDRCGVEYFEVSHLFWPRCDTIVPKIMATVIDEEGNAEYRRVFPWNTDPRSDEYRDFLRAMLPAFLAKMASLGGADKRCLFHISDEPYLDRLEIYKTCLSHVEDLLAGYRRIDAISDLAYYTEGCVTVPVPETMSIEPFLEADIPELWAYYCCDSAPCTSNRFMAMPSQRVRIIGTQLWKYNIAGFLHWGFNFWYSSGSTEFVNPYYITEGNYFGPAGDAFLVYPGPHGQPEESLRLHSFAEGLQDMRALQLAEQLCGRDAVLALVEADGPMTFFTCPEPIQWCQELREKVNALIASAL